MERLFQTRSRSAIVLLFAALAVMSTLASTDIVLAQDTTPPVITKSVYGTPQFAGGGNTYVASATTLRVSVEDAESGVKSCSITVTDNSNTAVLTPSCTGGDNEFTLPNSLPDGSYTISVTATNNDGNTSNDPMTVILDNTAPTLSKTIGDPQFVSGATTYVKSTTPISVSADDGAGSGVATCTLTGDALIIGSYIAGAGFFLTTPDGSKTFTVTCQDNLGNEASLTETDIVDDTAPSITITSPAGTYTIDQPNVVASYSCDDGAGSGVASCVGDLSDGASIDTSSSALGSHTFKVTASDKLGNTAPHTSDYGIQYSQTSGRTILPPLQQVSDPSQLTKTYKQGRTLPIKFQLFDDGAPVGTATATMKLYTLDRTEVSVEDSGKSNGDTNVFRYDPVAQQYVYNLSTKNLSQAVYKIVITLDDGTEISTYFRLQ